MFVASATARRKLAVIVVLLVALALTPSRPARAATCTVPGTHASIQTAVNDGTCTVIDVAAGTFSENITIDRSVTINGSGAGTTVVDGAQRGRVIAIGPTATVTLSGMAIQNGQAPGANGGAIFNAGTLQLSGSRVISNTAGNAGGIENTGTLTIDQTAISHNTARFTGGGIDNGGNLLVTGSTVSDNVAQGEGGANGGGGINNSYAMAVINSTISGNQAYYVGGGIFNYTSLTAYLFNVTIVHNQADANFNGTGYGGGIFNEPQGELRFANSIIALNTETTYSFLCQCYIAVNGDCNGTLTSEDFNLLRHYDTSRCSIAGTTTHNQLTDPQVGPLALNGGLTPTHALLPGSPAIDAGNSDGCRDGNGVLLPTDQRGFHRPAFGVSALRCDMGAYEYYPLSLFVPVAYR